VFAVDLQEEMLEEIKKRTVSQNIFFLKSEENTIPIEDKKTDLLLLAFVLHEAVDKVAFLKQLRRIIKEGGNALIVDWEKKEEERGPPFQERLERSEAVRLVEETGFTIEKISSLCNGSHYCITAKTS
jgi:ubiquinone/menaquinone biosynthesis C-methylase UbiE